MKKITRACAELFQFVRADNLLARNDFNNFAMQLENISNDRREKYQNWKSSNRLHHCLTLRMSYRTSVDNIV